MLRRCLVLVLVCAFAPRGGAQTPLVWTLLPGSPYHGYRFEDASFVSPQQGWIVNGSGETWQTTDGGASWALRSTVPDYLRSAAFVSAKPRLGISIGVIPASKRDPTERIPGYPNPHVQLVIATHLPDRGRNGHLVTSRNHINILSSDAVVALPGSHGTESELRLVGEYGKKAAIFYSDPGTIERFPAEIGRYDRIADLEAFLRAALSLPAADHRAG